MDSFLKSAQTPEFWVGVVFVGILLNVIANFLYRWIDGKLSGVSTRRAAKSAKEREKNQLMVAALVASKELRAFHFQDEIRLSLHYLVLYFLGVSFWIVSFHTTGWVQIGMLILMGLMYVLAIHMQLRASEFSAHLHEAHRIRLAEDKVEFTK